MSDKENVRQIVPFQIHSVLSLCHFMPFICIVFNMQSPHYTKFTDDEIDFVMPSLILNNYVQITQKCKYIQKCNKLVDTPPPLFYNALY